MINFYDYYKSFPNSEDLVEFLNDEENHPQYFEMVSLIESIEFDSNVLEDKWYLSDKPKIKIK